jgi:hypothetical protein
MDIGIEVLQSFLDDAWDAAPNSGNSLRDQLRAFEKQVNALFNTSGTLGSVAKNSASQSYRGPGLGSYTVPQVAAAWRVLINLFDKEKCRADAINAAGVAWFTAKYGGYEQDADQAVYDFCVSWLRRDFTQTQIDVSELRLQPTAAGLPIPLETW